MCSSDLAPSQAVADSELAVFAVFLSVPHTLSMSCVCPQGSKTEVAALGSPDRETPRAQCLAPAEGRENQLQEHVQRNRKPASNRVSAGSLVLESLRRLRRRWILDHSSRPVWCETGKQQGCPQPGAPVAPRSEPTQACLDAKWTHILSFIRKSSPLPTSRVPRMLYRCPGRAVLRGAPLQSCQGWAQAGFQARSSADPTSGVRPPLRAQGPQLPGLSGRVCWAGGAGSQEGRRGRVDVQRIGADTPHTGPPALPPTGCRWLPPRLPPSHLVPGAPGRAGPPPPLCPRFLSLSSLTGPDRVPRALHGGIQWKHRSCSLERPAGSVQCRRVGEPPHTHVPGMPMLRLAYP